jgi:phosphatidylinositol glycan class V
MPNLPLFLLAAPMLWLLSKTSVTVLQELWYPPFQDDVAPGSSPPASKGSRLRFCNFPQLAIPQIILAVAATTNFHVQIINRLSSGYPLWYLIVARWIVDQSMTPSGAKETMYAQWATRGFVMYAVVQGMLFAGFLPPA